MVQFDHIAVMTGQHQSGQIIDRYVHVGKCCLLLTIERIGLAEPTYRLIRDRV